MNFKSLNRLKKTKKSYIFVNDPLHSINFRSKFDLSLVIAPQVLAYFTNTSKCLRERKSRHHRSKISTRLLKQFFLQKIQKWTFIHWNHGSNGVCPGRPTFTPSNKHKIKPGSHRRICWCHFKSVWWDKTRKFRDFSNHCLAATRRTLVKLHLGPVW